MIFDRIAGGRCPGAVKWIFCLALGSVFSACGAGAVDALLFPDATNAFQFRLQTNASPSARQLFNTFEIEAFGELLLKSPGAETSQHNLLVNSAGPLPGAGNEATVLDRQSGLDWQFVSLDVSAAYHDRLVQYRRSILFVEPDLMVLHDHLVAREPANFQMYLHAPTNARVDKVWGDVRLDSAKSSLIIHAPGASRKPRNWEQVVSQNDGATAGSVTLRLGPTNQLSVLDLVTVFALRQTGERKEFAFKLVESNSAVGARIHRSGLPTLVAFKTSASISNASLTGFEFKGPVGVSVFKPKAGKP